MSPNIGLNTGLLTWSLYLGLAAFWYWSVRLVPDWDRLGWRSVIISMFGLA